MIAGHDRLRIPAHPAHAHVAIRGIPRSRPDTTGVRANAIAVPFHPLVGLPFVFLVVIRRAVFTAEKVSRWLYIFFALKIM